jgi:hypothetical protein
VENAIDTEAAAIRQWALLKKQGPSPFCRSELESFKMWFGKGVRSAAGAIVVAAADCDGKADASRSQGTDEQDCAAGSAAAIIVARTTRTGFLGPDTAQRSVALADRSLAQNGAWSTNRLLVDSDFRLSLDRTGCRGVSCGCGQ